MTETPVPYAAGRPDLAAIRANWAIGLGTYTNLHAARAATVNLLLDYAEALERERDAYRLALVAFVRGAVMVGVGEYDDRVAVLVSNAVIDRARALVGGEREV